jgi:hypothetical protein
VIKPMLGDAGEGLGDKSHMPAARSADTTSATP